MNKQRMLIVGARGFLGTYAVQAATTSGGFDVIRGDRTTTGEAGTVVIDIADAASVDRAFLEAAPDLVLLLGAISDIDRCERNPEEAFAINAHGAENVANACARSNARLLFTSTGAVFDGYKPGYREADPVTPLSVYGKTKVWAEKAVQGLTPNAAIVRFALVLGFSRRPGTKAILDIMIDKWKAGEPSFLSTQEKRNPLDAGSLSDQMIRILNDSALRGIFHLGSAESISRYELGLRIARRAGISTDLLHPQDEALPGRAPRGLDHFLLTDKIRSACGIEAESCDQVIERCFA
jgi:dTDP-4-dehydrorhamnose reductase